MGIKTRAINVRGFVELRETLKRWFEEEPKNGMCNGPFYLFGKYQVVRRSEYEKLAESCRASSWKCILYEKTIDVVLGVAYKIECYKDAVRRYKRLIGLLKKAAKKIKEGTV